MYKVTQRPKREKRKMRIRAKVSGTALRPRLTVFRSIKYIYGQLIDDTTSKTIVSVGEDVKKAHKKGVTKSDSSFELGKLLAQKAVEKGIKEAVFDRNGYRYHGRVQKFADGAREGGLHV